MKNCSILVGSQRVRVQFVDDLPDGVLGYFDPDKGLIQVVNGPHRDATVLHEWVHAFCHYMGWNEIIPEPMEEVIATQFAYAFLPIFQKGLGIKWQIEE